LKTQRVKTQLPPKKKKKKRREEEEKRHTTPGSPVAVLGFWTVYTEHLPKGQSPHDTEDTI
jgi:hypothetical protein